MTQAPWSLDASHYIPVEKWHSRLQTQRKAYNQLLHSDGCARRPGGFEAHQVAQKASVPARQEAFGHKQCTMGMHSVYADCYTALLHPITHVWVSLGNPLESFSFSVEWCGFARVV